MDSLGRHVAMAVFVPNRQAGPAEIVANGTMSFVQTPKRKVFLTNAHVWSTFQEKKNVP